MTPKLGVGFIGAGAIANDHIQGFKACRDDVEIIAFADVDEERAKQRMEQCGAKAYHKDYKELLKRDDIQIVDVVTPPFNHASISMEALQAGKHVLCEKPIALNLKEIDDIVKVRDESGKIFSGVFQWRLGTSARQAKRLIDEGKFGDIMLAKSAILWHRPASYYQVWWRGTWAQEGGGVTLGQACHAVDLLFYLVGEPHHIYAEMDTFIHNIEIEDTSVALARLNNGALAELTATVNAQTNRSRMEIYGTKLAVISPENPYDFDHHPWQFFCADENYLKEIQEYVAQEMAWEVEGGHVAQVKNFIDSVKHNTKPFISAETSRLSLEIITAIYKSAMTGTRVTFPISPDDPFYVQKPPDNGITKNYRMARS
jgi:predicted dehydrogenase